ncbi:MAG: fibronectin type III domain-containing protein [Oscillospiraceae bacterium]|nr:fibronectin type III domain-containing protein [Oscillospiraceae bacterium]
MKKLLAMLLAGLLLLTSMSVMAWADDEEDADLDIDVPLDDGADPGPRFYSLSELIEYRNYLRETDDDHGVYFESYDCVESLEGLYLPEGLTFDDITEFMSGTYFYYVYFKLDGITLEFTYYYNTEAAERIVVDTPIKYAKGGMYSGKVLESANGTTVYFWNFAPTHKTTVNENLNYLWYQDGYYYNLTLMGSHDTSETSYEELYGDELLAMSNAVYHPFSEAFDLSAEADEGKVKLSWNEIIEDESCTVYWKRSSSDEWKVAGTTSKHKVNIAGLKSQVSYDFKIEASGVESEIVTVTTE